MQSACVGTLWLGCPQRKECSFKRHSFCTVKAICLYNNNLKTLKGNIFIVVKITDKQVIKVVQYFLKYM